MSRTHPNNIDLGFNDLPFNQFESNTPSERPKKIELYSTLVESVNPTMFELIKQINSTLFDCNNIMFIVLGDFCRPLEILKGH